jgi:hypothetical protein
LLAPATSFVALLVASGLAFALSTVSGGGAGALLLPVLSALLPAVAVPVALTLGTTTSTVSKLALFWSHIRWDVARVFVPAALPGVVLGGLVLKSVNPLVLQLALGLFLLSNLRALFRAPSETPITRRSGWPKIAGIGFLAGLLSGLVGAVGVVFNDFYFREGLERDEIVATRAANELLLHLVKLALYCALGLVDRPVLVAGAALASGAVVGTALARRFLQHLPEALFRRLGYAAMVLSGALMVGAAGHNLRVAKGLAATLEHEPNEVELTGLWAGGSVALEWTYGEGIAVERAIPPAEVPPAIREAAETRARGRTLVKAEVVYQRSGRTYELRFDGLGATGVGSETIELRETPAGGVSIVE